MGGEKETLLSIGYRGSGWEDEKNFWRCMMVPMVAQCECA